MKIVKLKTMSRYGYTVEHRLSVLKKQMNEIEKDINKLNLKNEFRETALLTALRIRAYNIVEKLIDLNANVNICDNYGFFPIHEVAELDLNCDKSLKIFYLIFNKCTLNSVNYFGETPLQLAKSQIAVKEFLNNGCSIHYADLDLIYWKFGDCNLLRTALYMKISDDINKIDDLISPFIYILCKLNGNLNTILNEPKVLQSSRRGISLLYDIHHISRFCTLSPALIQLLKLDYCYFNKFFYKPKYISEVREAIIEIEKRRKSPKTLLELSRNETRKYFVTKYNIEQPRQLVNILRNSIGLPLMIEKIIMLERPIYPNISKPKSIPDILEEGDD